MTTWFLNNLGGPAGLVLLGVIISAIGAFWATKNQSKFEHEIAELNQKMLKTVTGGDSFCYYMIGFPHGTENKLSGYLTHVGEYPLYDLTIRITDSYKSDKIFKKYPPPVPLDKLREAEQIIRMDTYSGAGQANFYDSLSFWELPPDIDKQSLSIHFTARNGDWHQQISLRRVKGKWKFATKVTRTKGKGRVLLIPEWVPEGYPRNVNGEVEW